MGAGDLSVAGPTCVVHDDPADARDATLANAFWDRPPQGSLHDPRRPVMDMSCGSDAPERLARLPFGVNPREADVAQDVIVEHRQGMPLPGARAPFRKGMQQTAQCIPCGDLRRGRQGDRPGVKACWYHCEILLRAVCFGHEPMLRLDPGDR